MNADVIIIGGGISGLSTAYFLGKAGVRSLLIEKSDRLGGLIRTDLIDGCEIEAGPDSYIATKPAVTQLIREMPALAGAEISSNDAQRRIFVVKHGKLVPLPQGMAMMVPGQWKPALRSPLFSVATKFKLLTETLARPRERVGDFSIGDFVKDHFNREMLDYATEPLLTGVYGGAVDRLSAPSVLPRFVGFEKKHGSLIRGLRAEGKTASPGGSLFRSLKNGMQSLTDGLAESIRASTKTLHGEATQVKRGLNSWSVRVAGSGEYSAREVVLACPAHDCSSLLEQAAPALAAELSSIPYSSAIVVTLVYEKASVAHSLNGFGFLVPEAERHTVAAATWINTKFPSRVREGAVALRVFIVAGTAERLAGESDANLIGLVRKDVQRLMGIAAEPRVARVYAWPRSMPQYVVGHGQRCQRIAAATAALPGLHLVGNAYDGIGIPDCVRLAREKAKIITLSLAARPIEEKAEVTF